jgi:hypothetical protein
LFAGNATLREAQFEIAEVFEVLPLAILHGRRG